MEWEDKKELKSYKSVKKITPERIVKILERFQNKVSIEEANIILQFMKELAHIAVNQYLSNKTNTKG
ncbi:hypothetical protein [Elizabethkingia anophelis]|uniref:hypothetical protein n=1 Tax=Elizabethkingia anophelis TaxID=1117645 RepID=UPI00136E928B|nr:hypothetical protein [Elizabethkingia anophelis]MYY26308.1 hypothetical protein [Elizabethkingia anophelis]